ncbi:unnamed protein product [Blepharisma stoltei]|uniref:NADH dehydrogenase subunit 4L n=1 Tax=Blepharisma stoltei TaxID=1481888 RepID=A0AAU9K420_9CILI|nr:unnamed protein product [Blepharisma stoltei]
MNFLIFCLVIPYLSCIFFKKSLLMAESLILWYVLITTIYLSFIYEHLDSVRIIFLIELKLDIQYILSFSLRISSLLYKIMFTSEKMDCQIIWKALQHIVKLYNLSRKLIFSNNNCFIY